MPKINIKKYDSFTCSGSNFTTYGKYQFLMVAEYWDAVKPESNSPLAEFGKRRYGRCVEDCIRAIKQAVKTEYRIDNKIAKEVLLTIPVLVMRFTLHPKIVDAPRFTKEK
jgi:hypothetical protein